MNKKTPVLKVSGNHNQFIDSSSNGLVEVNGESNLFYRFLFGHIAKETLRSKIFWFAFVPFVSIIASLLIEYGFFN